MTMTKYLFVTVAALLATSSWAVTPKKVAKESDFEKAIKLYSEDYLDNAYEAFSKIANKAGDKNAGYAWAFMAAIKHVDEDNDQALADGKKAEGKIPATDSAFIAWYEDEMSEIYLATGDTAQAFSCVNKAIALQPNDGYYYGTRGLIYSKQKNWPMAEADLQKEVELAPDSVNGYIQLSIVQSRQGKLDEALAVMNKAVEKAPKDAQTYSYRASVYYNKEQYDAAVDDIITAYSITPDDKHCDKVLSLAYYIAPQVVTDKLTAKAQSDPANASKWQAYLEKAKQQ